MINWDKVEEGYTLSKIRQMQIEEQKQEIERLNNIIKQQDARNSRQRIANRKLLERNQDLVIENLKLNNIMAELETELYAKYHEHKDSECEELYAKAQEDKEILDYIKKLKERKK